MEPQLNNNVPTAANPPTPPPSNNMGQSFIPPKKRGIPTLVGLSIIIFIIAIGFCAAFAYEYYADSQVAVVDNQQTLNSQSQAKYQGYIKYENGACQTHIVNSSTKEDIVVKEQKTDDVTACDFCHVVSFSPDFQYFIQDCGTSPVGSLTVINRSTKKEFNMTSYNYFWLNSEELVFTDATGQERSCIQGSQPGVAKVNASTGVKIVLKQSDPTHGYYVKEISGNSISYLMTTYSKSVYGNDCSFTTTESDLVMDGNGKDQVTDSQTAGWKTYKNDKFAFEFQYPTDWQLQELNPSLGLVIIYPNSKSSQVINKTISTSDEITLAVVDGKYINKSGAQETTVNSQSWFLKTYNRPFDGGTENGLEYLSPVTANSYIDITTGVSNKEILSKIISTFKFTK